MRLDLSGSFHFSRRFALAAALALLVALGASGPLSAQSKSKYKGPRPEQADLPYLRHGSKLVALDTGEATEEKRKEGVAYVTKGAAASARTPLAEPILLMKPSAQVAEKFQLYRMDVKNGNRELFLPTNPKKRMETARPRRMTVAQLEPGLVKLEVNETLPQGEYCLSPDGSNAVYCFQVF